MGGCGVSCLSYLDGVLALGEVHVALLRLVELGAGLSGGQASSDSASLLGAEIQRQVLLVLVEQAELGALLEVDDGEDAGDRLADVVAIWRMSVFWPIGQKFEQCLQGIRQEVGTYILFSLAPDELIFWILS